MTQNKHVIMITSYCNTIEKLDMLNECISHLKKIYPDIDIMIYAHYPIPLEYQQMVKYYIYDSTNPYIDMKIKVVLKWINTSAFLGYPSKYVAMLPDTGWAVLSMWNKGLLYLQSHKYEYAHIIDYDIDVFGHKFKNLLDESIIKLENISTEAMFTKPGYDDHESVTLTHASMNINSYLTKIMPQIHLKEYLQEMNDCVERYVCRIIKRIDLEYEIKKDVITNFCRSQNQYIKKLDNLKTICAKNRIFENQINLIIHDALGDIDKIIIQFNDDCFHTIVPEQKQSYISLNIKDLNPKYIKILEYNGTITNYTVISSIDDIWLERNFIEPI